MRKRIIPTIIFIILLLSVFAQSAFAITHTVIVKPTYTEDTVLCIDFKDGQLPGTAEYVYTGQKIKPEVIVTKVDKTVADPSEYKLTYGEDCDKTGVHFVTAEYLKSGYKISIDYWVVPGKTNRVDMSAKNGKLTLSWSSVAGATCYRVYKYDPSTGNPVELFWDDGSIATLETSRTFTDLKPGKTYEFGIMALPGINWMPTQQIRTFKFTVPKSGDSSMNLVPGINETTNSQTTKPETTKKLVENNVPTTVSELTTVIPTTSETTKKLVENNVPTTVSELTTVIPTTSGTTTEVAETKEITTQAKTTVKNKKSTTQKSGDEKSEKEEFDVWNVVPIAVAVVAIGAGAGIIIYKKKK